MRPDSLPAPLAPPRMSFRSRASVAFALLIPVFSFADPIRVAGSDLAEASLVAGLKEGPRPPGKDWVLKLEGTNPGLAALRSGSVEAAVVLLESLPTVTDAAIEFLPLAYRAPSIVVSSSNPIAQISLPALAAVVGEGEIENFLRWSELGLPGDWSARTISVHTGSVADPLLLEYIRLRVLKSARLKGSITSPATIESLLARLREDEAALGILSAPPSQMAGLRTVPVALANGEIAFGPTPDNVHAGDYPMRMVMAVAVARERTPRSNAALRVLLSDEMAQAFAAHGFVPVPGGARARLTPAASFP